MNYGLLDWETLEKIGNIDLSTSPIKEDNILYNKKVYLVTGIMHSSEGISLLVRENHMYENKFFTF